MKVKTTVRVEVWHDGGRYEGSASCESSGYPLRFIETSEKLESFKLQMLANGVLALGDALKWAFDEVRVATR